MTTETIKTMLTRYSCRAYTDKMPPEKALKAIAEAAVAAPSAMNQQNWRVIVLKNKKLIADLEIEGMKYLASQDDKGTYERIMSRGGKMFYNAPCMIIVPVNKLFSGNYALTDLGIVAQNIALAATSLGINSVICGMIQNCFAGIGVKEFKQKLGIPEKYEIELAVLLGYAEKHGQPHELDYSKISFVE